MPACTMRFMATGQVPAALSLTDCARLLKESAGHWKIASDR